MQKKLVLREQEVIRRDLELQGALRSLSKKEVEVSGLRVQAKDSELELQAVRKEAQETKAGLQQAREEAANLEAELREVRAQQQQAEAEGSAAIEQLRSQVSALQFLSLSRHLPRFLPSSLSIRCSDTSISACSLSAFSHPLSAPRIIFHPESTCVPCSVPSCFLALLSFGYVLLHPYCSLFTAPFPRTSRRLPLCHQCSSPQCASSAPPPLAPHCSCYSNFLLLVPSPVAVQFHKRITDE